MFEKLLVWMAEENVIPHEESDDIFLVYSSNWSKNMQV